MKTFEELGGPLDILFGLPMHPLLVHGAVVLVPLVALSAIATTFRPKLFNRYSKAILILAVVAQVSLFLAKASGEPFQERLGKEVARHAKFGELAPLTFIPLLALLLIRWWLERSENNNKKLQSAVSVLMIAASVLALIYIFLTGHSGAESVWGWVKDR